MPNQQLFTMGSMNILLPFFGYFLIRYFLYLHFKCSLPFPHFLTETPRAPIPFPLPLLTNPPTPFSLSWHSPTLDIKPSQDQGLLHTLMSNKTILCYIFSQSHASLCVYFLFGGLLCERSDGTGWLILLFLLLGCKPLQLLGNFSLAHPLGTLLSPMVG